MNVEVERLLDLAAALPEERRSAFLARECRDARVRAEVESLLEYVTGAEEFFDEAIQGAAADVRTSREPAPGDMIGAYRVVSLLGRGGMGAVYLAERADGELQQKVAIKLLRGDCFRPVWRERFLTERQLLASLQHPSIIHVVDAGHTREGRPYLVVEYVEGVPIDTYAATLDVRQRLELFLRVCEGVAHAHRRLIIHRDLKPSNILVDAGGQPKLLDFGIARLLDNSGSTQTVERLLTPNYASPEQIAGAPQTTATDIYSLGVVLFQLLTGETPRRATAGKKQKALEASALNPRVPRDLDYIIAKAMRPEPEDRYLSVDELARDIRAALDWRPVQARAGDRWYRVRRFLRHYWLPLAAVAAVVVSMAAGLYIANRQRAIAERRFVAVRELANKLFDIDVQVAQLPGSSKSREMIVDTALEYLRRMSAEAPADPGMALELGAAYMRAGRVLGVNISPNLGQTEQADNASAKAQQLIESVLASEPRNRSALLRAAQVAHDRMIIAGDRFDAGRALAFAGKSVEYLDRYFATGQLSAQSDHKEAQQVILTLINIANRYQIADQYDRSIELSRRAREIAGITNWPSQGAASLIIVAMSQRAKGDLEAALSAIQESVRILEPKPDEKPTGRTATYTLALLREAQILAEPDAISMGRRDEAVVLLERVIASAADFARRDPSDFSSQHRLFNASSKLARLITAQDPARAAALFDDCLRILTLTSAHGSNTQNEIRTLAASVDPLLRLRRYAEAGQRLDAAFAKLRQAKLYPAQQVALGSEADQALRARAEYEAATEGAGRAADTYRGLLERVPAAANLTNAVQLAALYRDSARAYRSAGQGGEAARLDSLRRDLWREWGRKLPESSFVKEQASNGGADPLVRAGPPGPAAQKVGTSM